MKVVQTMLRHASESTSSKFYTNVLTLIARGKPRHALAVLDTSVTLLSNNPDRGAPPIAIGTAASAHHALGEFNSSVNLLPQAARMFHEPGDTG